MAISDSMRRLILGYSTALKIDWNDRVDAYVEKLTATPICLPKDEPDQIVALAHLCNVTYLANQESVAAAELALVDPSLPLGSLRRVCGFHDGVGVRRALAVRDDSELVIAIRGSANLLDWMYNLTGELVGTQRLHAGFTEIAEELWPWLVALLREQHRLCRRITLTGHSLGGAVALLLGCKLVNTSQTQDKPLRVVTFGAPKVGSAELDLACQVTAYRMLGDLIPELTLNTDYTFHGQGYLLTGEDEIRPAPDIHRSGILTWAKSVGAVGAQARRLMEAGTFCGEDLAPIFLFSKGYQIAANPSAQVQDLVPGYGLMRLLAMIPTYMREPETSGSSNTFSLGAKQLAKVLLLEADAALEGTLSEVDEVLATAKVWEPNLYIQSVMLLVLRRAHTMSCYCEHLIRAAVRQ